MWRPPASADTLHVGNLTKGIKLDLRSTEIPDGGFLELQGYTVQTQGPQRADGLIAFTEGSIPYPLVDIIALWNTDGTQILVGLTDRNLYLLSAGVDPVEIAWAYATGTAVISGVTVTGTGTVWTTNDIRPGDFFRSGGNEAIIVSVGSNTEITLANAIVLAVDGSYSIQRTFGSGESIVPDWVSFANYLLIADGDRPLIAYDVDAGTLDYWINDPAYYIATGVTFSAATVAYFQDRVWAAFTDDSVDDLQRQRIRWSGLANTRDFSFTQNYLDLPYTGGAIIKLVPLNNILIAYFEDAVFTGIPTNNPNIPLRWERLETGGIGLVNNKSVAPFIGGHFWIGNDNFYFTNGQSVEAIGEAVLAETFDLTKDFSAVRAAMDLKQRCVAFGIPGNAAAFTELWLFNYVTRAWSKRNVQASTSLSNPIVDDPVTWDTLPAAMTWETFDEYYRMWNLIGQLSSERFMFVGGGCCFWLSDPDVDLEYITDSSAGEPLDMVATTPDHTFGDEDFIKTAVRFALKIRRPIGRVARALLFTLEGSPDQGVTWKSLGTLSFSATDTEAYINFRLLGATMRFRITPTVTETAGSPVTDTMVIGSHILSGYSLRIAGRGAELALKN